MAAIADIVRKGKGTAGAWRVYRESDGDVQVASLYHYGTRMLSWNVDDPQDEDFLSMRTGWGSVSDQNGMNKAFRILGIPYRFRRDGKGGGPRNERI